MATSIDWMVVATVVPPLLAVPLGAWINHLIEGRPRLLSYLVNASAIHTRRQPGGIEPQTFHTHSIVVRNTSRKEAKNIRLGHRRLPDYTIFPSIDHQVVHLPDESVEILIPQMVRSEQITISYLYQPPLTFDQVNTYAKSDEGFAKITPMVVVAPQSRLWKTVSRVLMLTGVVAITYALFKLVGVQQ